MAHTHANYASNSSTETHVHEFYSGETKCVASGSTLHLHQIVLGANNSHNHAYEISFGNAVGLAVHAITLVSCGNGGGAHNTHAMTDVLGGACDKVGCDTSYHYHATGGLAEANGGAVHSHTLPACNTNAGVGTADNHTHTFTVYFNSTDGHTHAITGSLTTIRCYGTATKHGHTTGVNSSNVSHYHALTGTTAAGGDPPAAMTIPVAFHHLKSMNNAHVTD